jgi:hypothetical protein
VLWWSWAGVYEVQADAEDQPLRLWQLRLGRGRRLLELKGGGQGLDGTAELHQSTVARQVNDPPSAPIEHWLQPFGACSA